MGKDVPKEVIDIIRKLEEAGFSAYVVGGCVRDLYLGRRPKDWDVATSARPEEIQGIFPNNFYENAFFTVTVLTDSTQEELRSIEVTTFRSDFEYSDRRRPGKVEYAETIDEDLSRRDFTVNAIALRLIDGEYETVDPFNGHQDLKDGFIKAVGEPDLRFQEDALRMMRAVRLAAQLGLVIDGPTRSSISKNCELLDHISKERVRDEFIKVLSSNEGAANGVEELRETGLLQYIIPELLEGVGVAQNKHHTFTVWEHNLRALDYAASQGWSIDVRLAALLHDVAKPQVKQGDGPNASFHAHEVVGASMTKRIMERLKFSRKDTERIRKLVRYHMFFYDVGTVTDSSVRRLLRKVGQEDMQDLLRLRMADRIGSGVPKAEPYRLRHFQYLIERVSKDPISAKMLKVNGKDIMQMTGISPGPQIGHILDVLLSEVLDEPERNTREYLEGRVKELVSIPAEELSSMSKEAKEKVEEVEEELDENTKKKYFVR